MTERVVIEGHDLAVTTDDAEPALDPKRRRPPPYIPTGDGLSKAGRTLEQIMSEPNPYWDDDGQPVVMQQDEPYVETETDE